MSGVSVKTGIGRILSGGEIAKARYVVRINETVKPLLISAKDEKTTTRLGRIECELSELSQPIPVSDSNLLTLEMNDGTKLSFHMLETGPRVTGGIYS
jgi:hypothetical protein